MLELLTALAQNPKPEYIPVHHQKSPEVRIAQNIDKQFISPEMEYVLRQQYNLLFKGEIKAANKDRLKDALVEILIKSLYNQNIDDILLENTVKAIRAKKEGENGIIQFNGTQWHMYYEVVKSSRWGVVIRFVTMKKKERSIQKPTTVDV